MDTSDEINLLPERLRTLSLSDREVVHPYPEVCEALTLLASNSVGFLGWEGWARYPNGHGHYNEYPGINVEPEPGEDWDVFVTRSTIRCGDSINEAWHRWNSQPKDERVLYFCVTSVDEAWWMDHLKAPPLSP